MALRTDLKSVISPASKFHSAVLVIEREPGNINLASTLEDARWDYMAGTIMSYHNVSLVGVVETLMGTVKK